MGGKTVIPEFIKEMNVEFLCKNVLGNDDVLTENQSNIIKDIVFERHKRIIICAYTRYGKTATVAKAVLLYILFHANKEIKLIGPKYEQTEILRNYIAKYAVKSPHLRKMIEISVTGVERIKKEVSKKRITFTNNTELQILSAEGDAERLMGFGASGLLIVDERVLINPEAEAKISRMLLDSPDTILIELLNPWNKENQAWSHWNNPNFKKYHISAEDGIKEGRHTVEQIREIEEDIVSPIQRTVLIDSDFPDDTEDALIKWEWIQRAINKPITFDKSERVSGLDCAEAGLDLSVLSKAFTDKNRFKFYSIDSWHKADTTETVSKVKTLTDPDDLMGVDAIGVGKGIADQLKKDKYNVKHIKVGMAPTRDKTQFLNRKSQFYWNLRRLFEEDKISIPKNKQLIKELNLMRYEITANSGKIKIIDPAKSPDFADSVMLCTSVFLNNGAEFGTPVQIPNDWY